MGYFDNFPEKVPGIPGFQMNIPLAPAVVKGDVGLELELEGRNFPAHDTVARDRTAEGVFWAPKTDGSLRGEAYEYVFNAPATIEGSDLLVNNLYAAFQRHGTELRPSNRCSTHVHLNVSSWKVDKISTFFALWAAIEPALIDYAGTDRKSNHFCLGVEATTATIDAWQDFLRTGKPAYSSGLKYSALNILRLFDLGSLEVRIAPAWRSAKPVNDWTRFLWMFREYVDTFPSPAAVPEELSYKGPLGLFVEICNRDTRLADFRDDVLSACTDFNPRGMETFRSVQSLCFDFPWADWNPMISKVHVPNPFGKSPSKGSFRPIPTTLNRATTATTARWILDTEATAIPDEPRTGRTTIRFDHGQEEFNRGREEIRGEVTARLTTAELEALTRPARNTTDIV